MSESVSWVIFPGEGVDGNGTTVGHVYVMHGGTVAATYEVAGGPPPGHGYGDRGGHRAGETPAGRYVLGPQEHHTSRNWPNSVVPWGAKLRERDGIVEYQVGDEWKPASGRDGNVTHALRLWATRSNQSLGAAAADLTARMMFQDQKGGLVTEWKKNDFGKWSWNLMREGHRSAYYVHTTAEDEAATEAGKSFDLLQSHGCLHIRPDDRDAMMAKGYVKKGMRVEIRKYGQMGPPR